MLRAEGYYDAKLETRLDLERKPAGIAIEIDAVPRYEIGQVSWIGADGGALNAGGLELDELGIQLGQPARSADVLQAAQCAP